MNAQRQLLTETAAIEMLGLHDLENPKASIRWLVRKKKLSAVRIGRGILRYDPDELSRFINQSRV